MAERADGSGPERVTALVAAFVYVISRAGRHNAYVFKWLRRRADEFPVPVSPCADCGHDTSDHPWPGRKDLTACAACIWEEDIDRRRTEDICRRQFPRHQS